MYLLGKLKKEGVLWFLRRLVREFVEPTTSIGKRIKPCFFFTYFLINKPINYLFFLTKAREKSTNKLYFFYDLDVEPITYDFAWALCIANAKREELDLPQLCVVFVPGSDQGLRKEAADYEEIVSRDARHWRLHSILFPVIKLLPCPVSIIFCGTRDEAMLVRERQASFVYPEKYNVTFPVPCAPEQAMQYKQKFMTLRAENQALNYISNWLFNQAGNKKVIVITLRQYGYMPERNSNLKEWIQFANRLNRDEFFIIFIPDTEQALNDPPDELKAFQIFYPASWNLNLRIALYELAYLNLGINTGPMSLCWLNPCSRYLSFKTCVKNVPQASIEVLKARGFVPNENPPFTNRYQKWIWEDDNVDIISREFWLMCEELNKRIEL